MKVEFSPRSADEFVAEKLAGTEDANAALKVFVENEQIENAFVTIFV